MFKNFLFKIILISNIILAIYILVVLVSFNPSDLSWLNATWQKKSYNFGGNNGAWLADTLLFFLGISAYTIPFIIIYLCWMIFFQYKNQKYINYFLISIKLIGIILLLISSCSLFNIFNIKNIWCFSSGGILGIAISDNIKKYFNLFNYKLILIILWIIGYRLYIGKSLFKFLQNLAFLIKKIFLK